MTEDLAPYNPKWLLKALLEAKEKGEGLQWKTLTLIFDAGHISGQVCVDTSGIEIDLEDLVLRYDAAPINERDRPYLDSQNSIVKEYIDNKVPIFEKELTGAVNLAEKTRYITQLLDRTSPALTILKPVAWMMALTHLTTPRRFIRSSLETQTAGYCAHILLSETFEHAKTLFPEALQEEPLYKNTVDLAHIHRVQASNYRKWLDAIDT